MENWLEPIGPDAEEDVTISYRRMDDSTSELNPWHGESPKSTWRCELRVQFAGDLGSASFANAPSARRIFEGLVEIRRSPDFAEEYLEGCELWTEMALACSRFLALSTLHIHKPVRIDWELYEWVPWGFSEGAWIEKLRFECSHDVTRIL